MPTSRGQLNPHARKLLSGEPQWPALIRFDGDPELVCSGNACDARVILDDCDEDTILLDSSGTLYFAGGSPSKAIELSVLTQWIRQHAAAFDQCCVAKIHVRDIADAISFVAQLEEAR